MEYIKLFINIYVEMLSKGEVYGLKFRGYVKFGSLSLGVIIIGL